MNTPILRLRVLPSVPPIDGKQAEFQSTDTHLQWRLVGDEEWQDLIPLADITGPEGAVGPGAEFRIEAGVIEWRNVGDENWNELITVDDLFDPIIVQAEQQRDFAARWASDPEDGDPIDDGTNPPGQSSFHWSEKSKAWATGTNPDGLGSLSAREEADRAEAAANSIDSVTLANGYLKPTDAAYGATGDGVTDDTTAVTNAVAAAFAAGVDMFWPAGTYLTTASIPNLHSVRHRGSGAIKRGSDLFYVEPTNAQTNRLYANPTGNDANDGLSASQPVADYGVHFTRLSNYGPILPGIWRIILAAGTYLITTTKSIPQYLETRNGVTLTGPTVAHPGVPTAIIDAGGAAASGVSHIGSAKIAVQYVKFQDCRPSVGGGIYISQGATLFTENVHCDGCGDSIYAVGNSSFRIKGGIISNATRQGVVCSIGSFGTVGYGAGGDTANGTIIENCPTGLSFGEVSTCHVDDCIVRNNTTGLLVYDNSRSNVVRSDFRNNGVALESRSGGIWVDSGIVLNIGTAFANTVNVRYRGQRNALTTVSKPINNVAFNRASHSHTGVTGRTTVTPVIRRLTSNYFMEDDRIIRFDIYGTKTGSAGTATIYLEGNGAIMVEAPLIGSGAQSFHLQGFVCATGLTAQRYWYDLSNSVAGLQSRIGIHGGASADMSGEVDLTVGVNLANAADSVSIFGVTLDLAG